MSVSPLDGIRIVDLTMWWAGPITTAVFAQLGAEVIKVESTQRIDGWRLTNAFNDPERSHTFNAANLSKLGVTLDLSRKEGVALLLDLVAGADALVENYSPRVMSNFGLTDEVLFSHNPKLVILSMPAFGSTGPWGDFVGFAANIEQLSGLPNLVGYDGGSPSLSGTSLADPIAGFAGAFTLLAALYETTRSGGGIHIDLSQLEVLTSLVVPGILEAQATGKEPERRGNAGKFLAPQGIYPCKTDDTWVAIACEGDDSFARFANIMNRLDLVADPRFSCLEARVQSSADLDEVVATWTREREAVDVQEVLQREGIAAGIVANPAQLHDDAHLWERGYFTEVTRQFVGTHAYPRLPFTLSEQGDVRLAAAPTLGQHNQEVLGNILGLTRAQLEDLRSRGIIGEEPV